jgi:lipoprotein-anchoring transpeptidase ErfK/SrfK
MRRTTFGLAGLVLVAAGGTAVVGLSFMPTPHAAARPATAVAAAAPAAATVQAADLVGKRNPLQMLLAALFGSPTAAPAPGTQAAAPAPAPLPAGTTVLASPKFAALTFWNVPNGNIASEISATTWGGPTALPVVAVQGNWLQIRVYARPNGLTGWVSKEDVNLSTTNYRIGVSVSQRSLTLYQNDQSIYSAPVGVGQPQWPTPVGPSFVAAKVPTPANLLRTYGPLVIITATHSNVFTEFDGGDGTVGIHGYPSDPASTMGVASSHGCIRSSPQTMSILSQVPVGTPIDITP